MCKFDTNGVYQWVRSFGGNDYDNSQSIAIDNNNNIYISGNFIETNVDMNFNEGTDLHSSNGIGDAFLMKLR